MTITRRIVVTAAVLTILGATTTVAAQQRPYRLNDQQVKDLVSRIELHTKTFSANFDRAIDRTRIDAEDRIQLVGHFGQAIDRLSDRVNSRRSGTADVEDVLRRASLIDSFVTAHHQDTAVGLAWQALRRDLDELARAYGVAWNETSSERSSSRDTPAGGGTEIYHRLTGTYQLDSSRSDNPREAAEQAARTVPSEQQSRTYENLMNRLEAPDVIAIIRNENSVTIGSSRGHRATFEADGQVFTEQGPTGRTTNTRTTFHGDQLVVTTTGNAGNDFTVTFEPIDDGRTLRVTRRIFDDGLREPVTLRSIYRRFSDQAQWDLPARTDGVPASRGPASGNFLVPGGIRVMVTLDTAVSTERARQGDRLTMTTRNPSRYEGAVIEAFVSRVNGSGRLSGRADLSLVFESIRLRDGRTYQFAGVIENVRTPDGEAIRVDNEGAVEEENSQTEKTVQRGAIGAAVGAIIGAVAGGGQGATIGAVIGAGAGAGTVIVEGREQLDLPRGTELTIISSTPRGPAESTGAQR